MNQTITAKKVVTHPYFALICFLSLWLILPRYGGAAAMMIGSAGLLS
ncbi:MAG: hypothetical protein FD138_2047, partial [Planctomycetota bacterium]